MTRRWKAGDFGEISGLRYRIVQGAKHPDDLCLEIVVEGYWLKVPMALGFLLTDFFFENEEVLYPSSPHERCNKFGCDGRPHQGGYKYLSENKHAALHGWQKTIAGLRAEKAAKQAALFGNEENC